MSETGSFLAGDSSVVEGAICILVLADDVGHYDTEKVRKGFTGLRHDETNHQEARMTPIPVPPVAAGPTAPLLNADQVQHSALLEAAQDLETTFLSEMLKAMKFDSVAGGFGSNQGAEQFGSFLRDAQAEELTKAGGIGLAEALFKAMVVQADA